MSMDDRSIVLLTKREAIPPDSWWACPDPEFHAKAEARWPLMRRSRFGQLQHGQTVEDGKADRRRQFA